MMTIRYQIQDTLPRLVTDQSTTSSDLSVEPDLQLSSFHPIELSELPSIVASSKPTSGLLIQSQLDCLKTFPH